MPVEPDHAELGMKKGSNLISTTIKPPTTRQMVFLAGTDRKRHQIGIHSVYTVRQPVALPLGVGVS